MSEAPKPTKRHRRFIVKKANCGCWAVYDRRRIDLPRHFDNRIRARRAAEWLNRA